MNTIPTDFSQNNFQIISIEDTPKSILEKLKFIDSQIQKLFSEKNYISNSPAFLPSEDQKKYYKLKSAYSTLGNQLDKIISKKIMADSS